MEIMDETANIPLDIYEQVINGFSKPMNRFVIEKNEYEYGPQYIPYETTQTKEELLDKVNSWINKNWPNGFILYKDDKHYDVLDFIPDLIYIDNWDCKSEKIYENDKSIGYKIVNPIKIFTIDEWFEYFKKEDV